MIRDERDLARHTDYIHYNPVKHGHVAAPDEWPWSTFQKYVERGVYDKGWGQSEPASIRRWQEQLE